MSVKRVATQDGKNLKSALRSITDLSAKIGWFENSKYDDPVVPVAEIATIQEFGYPEKFIPPRPFFRPTIEAKQKEWIDTIESGVKSVLKNTKTLDQVMNYVANRAEADVSKTIATLESPPLNPRTIKNRLFRKSKKFIGKLTKPLIDTGIMFQTLTYVVEKE